jgi:hypothetical protein
MRLELVLRVDGQGALSGRVPVRLRCKPLRLWASTKIGAEGRTVSGQRRLLDWKGALMILVQDRREEA